MNSKVPNTSILQPLTTLESRNVTNTIRA